MGFFNKKNKVKEESESDKIKAYYEKVDKMLNDFLNSDLSKKVEEIGLRYIKRDEENKYSNKKKE